MAHNLIEHLIIAAAFGALTLFVGGTLCAAVWDVLRGGPSRAELAQRLRDRPIQTTFGALMCAAFVFFLASGLSGAPGGPSIFR